MPSPDRRYSDLLRLGLLALGARLVTAAAVSAHLRQVGQLFLFSDESTYISEAQSVSTGGSSPHAYSHLLGLVFKVTGSNTWFPRALNVVVGTVLVLVIYELVRTILGRRAALLAAGATAIWPSLLLWSVVILKDPLTLLCLFAGLLGAAKAFRGSWVGAASSLIFLAGAETLRPYAFVVASIALVVGLVVHMRRTSILKIAPAAALVLAVGVLGMSQGEGFLGVRFITYAIDPKSVVAIRADGSRGETSFANPTDDLGDIAVKSPRSFVYSLLGPFPWSPGSTEAKALLAIELPLWYLALAAALFSLRQLYSKRLLRPLTSWITFSTGILLVLIIFHGNGGTALRHRAMILPLILAMAATVPMPRLMMRVRVPSLAVGTKRPTPSAEPAEVALQTVSAEGPP